MNALQVYGTLAIAALSSFGGWKVHSWYDAADREAYERGAAKAMETTAEAIAKIDLPSKVINRNVQTEIRTNTVYRDCVVPVSGVRLIRASFGAEQALTDYSIVPTVDASARNRDDHGGLGAGTGVVGPPVP